MKYYLKKVMVLSLTVALSLSCNISSLAGEWVDGNFGEMFKKDDGKIATKEIIEYQGKRYLTDIMGRRSKGWYKLDENWYYLDEETGVMAYNGTVNINGVNYTFAASGAWIPDEASITAGRVYRSAVYNIELTIPYYYEMKMSYNPTYLMPTFTDTRPEHSFSVHLDKFYCNSLLEDIVSDEVRHYERNMCTIEKVADITINNRTYTEILIYDKTGEPLWCYDKFYYYTKKGDTTSNITSITFSYNAEVNRDAGSASILATMKPLE